MGLEKNQESAGLINGYSTATPNTTHTFLHFWGSAWESGAQARLATSSEGRGSEEICEAPISVTYSEAATLWAPGTPPRPGPTRASGHPRACRSSAGTTRPARLSVPVPRRRSARPAARGHRATPVRAPRLSPTVQLGKPRQATSTRTAGRTRDKLSTHRTVDAMFTQR